MVKKKKTDLETIGSSGLKDTGLISGKSPFDSSGRSSGKTAAPDANGIDSAGKNVMTQGVKATPVRVQNKAAYDTASGGYAIRQSLVNAGVPDSDIKWDGKYITVGSKKFLPRSNVNGVTYAPKSEIDNFTNEIFKEKGIPLKQANAYINEYGLTGLLGWNDATKQVTIDGKPVDYAYVDDNGNAWVRQDVLDAAYKEAADRRNMTKNTDADDGYYRTRDSMRDRSEELIDRMKNWDFTAEDIKTDPEYRARAKQYRAEAMRSYLNQINDMAARNGGNLSGMAVQAAGGAYNQNMEGLHGIAAEVRDKAYQRYMNVLNAENTEINKQRDEALTEYNMKLAANDRARQQNEALRADELNRNLNAQNIAQNTLTIEQARLEADYKNARARGFWLPEEAARWGVDASTSPFDPEIAQKRENWYGAEKAIYGDQLDMQTDKYKEETSFGDEVADENAKDQMEYSKDLADHKARIDRENAYSEYAARLKYEKDVIDYQKSGNGNVIDEAYVKKTVEDAMAKGYAPTGTSYRESFPGAYVYLQTHNDKGRPNNNLTEEEQKDYFDYAAAAVGLVEDEEEEE